MKKVSYWICIFYLLFKVCIAEAHPPPSARNLFLAGRDQWIMLSMKSIENSDYRNFGLRCSLLKPTRAGGWTETNPVTEAGTDGAQFRLEANAESWLYVLQWDGEQWVLILPKEGTETGGHRIHAPRSPRVVIVSGEWVQLENEPALKPLFIVLSRLPITPLERIARGSSDSPSGKVFSGPVRKVPGLPVSHGIVNFIRSSVRIWDLLFENTNDAFYVVNKKALTTPRIVVDIGLK
jgi:hypothetical protein